MDVHDDWFEQWSTAVEAHPLHAQVLLGTRPDTEDLRRASGVLREAGVEILGQRVNKQGGHHLVTYLVTPEDLGESVIRLAEAGFRRLRGISPKKRGPV